MDKFLHYGALGLVLALSILNFKLLSEEQKKERPRKQIISAVYSFMLFAIIVMIIGIVAEFVKNPDNLKTLGYNNNQINVKEELPKRKLQSLNLSDYYINKEEGYFISKPEIRYNATHASNLAEYFNIIKLESNKINEETLKESLVSSPFGEMVFNVKVDQLAFGESHEIKIIVPKDDVFSRIDEQLERLNSHLDTMLEKFGEKPSKANNPSIEQNRKNNVVESNDTIKSTFQNKITISAFDINRYKGKDFTLEKFFFFQLGNRLYIV